MNCRIVDTEQEFFLALQLLLTHRCPSLEGQRWVNFQES